MGFTEGLGLEDERAVKHFVLSYWKELSFTVLGKMKGRTRTCLGSKYKEFRFEIVKSVMFIRHPSENTHTPLNRVQRESQSYRYKFGTFPL